MKQQLFNLLGKHYTWLATHYRQAQTYCYSVFHPYHYDAKRYKGTFLEEPCEFEYSDELEKHVDRVIYIFWTGDNEITPNRLEGIKSLEMVSGVEVKLITPKNLSKYIKEDDPLPERRERHRASLKAAMENEGLYGQNFRVIHSALNKKSTKNVRITQEGIRIEWEGSANDVNYSVSDRDENGQQTITIRTGGITQLQ